MLALRKAPNWRARLSETIEAARRKPFAGDHHCGMFVADCIEAMTGVDLAAGYRGLPLVDAYVILRGAGFADLPAFAAAHLEEIHPSRAVAGDVAMFVVDPDALWRRWAAGIVNGERVTVLRRDGLGTVPLDLATKAFRVPA
jgi:hypothetical protein